MSAPKSSLPRSRMTPERIGELYDAVLSLLAEVGYDALTIDAVAARARTSKTTLYRQWSGKPDLVASALRHIGPAPEADFDTGSLRGDLLALAARQPDDDRAAAIIPAMNEAARRDPMLHNTLRELIFDPTMRAFTSALDRAEARGELAPNSPARDYIVHLMMGASMAYTVIENRAPDARFIERYIDAVVMPALGVR
ncbi:TetR/AcrR family transcriptional regulator [Nocardia sp. NPDC055321]